MPRAPQNGARKLVEALLAREAYPHPVKEVRLVETHISWVLLTGNYAYKLKKPVSLGFLDFSTLAQRRHFCEEELRLNQRTAPQLYLDVVPITGSPAKPKVEGDGEPIEYAVKMAQFPDEARLDRVLESGALSVQALRDFGAHLAQLHAAADRHESRRYGSPALVAQRMLENVEQLETLLRPAERACFPPLLEWTRAELAARREHLAERATADMVRECHGDLHLSNLVALAEGIVAFDCIEFDPALRWIDVIDDVAFLVMDLQVRGSDDLGYAFVDSYLAASGDYGGAQLFDLYRVHRSLVRAKVAGIARRAQEARRHEMQDKLERHLALAARYIAPRSPVLALMHGLTASGKSWLAEQLVPRLPALRLRSDVERKRLAGLTAQARSDSPVGGGLYDSAHDRAVYARLAELASPLLRAGHHVIVDAAFLRRNQRQDFYALARSAGARCIRIECNAPRRVLEQRIRARATAPNVSEADEAVLDYQLTRRETASAAEDAVVIQIDTTGEVDLPRLVERILEGSQHKTRDPRSE
jgi:aminoglycoside phosphotransferase family enzyme/predicted kinase